MPDFFLLFNLPCIYFPSLALHLLSAVLSSSYRLRTASFFCHDIFEKFGLFGTVVLDFLRTCAAGRAAAMAAAAAAVTPSMLSMALTGPPPYSPPSKTVVGFLPPAALAARIRSLLRALSLAVVLLTSAETARPWCRRDTAVYCW